MQTFQIMVTSNHRSPAYSGRSPKACNEIHPGLPKADLSYNNRLARLNFLPISYWHKIRDLVFFFEAINGFYNIDLFRFVTPKVLIRSTRHSCSLDYIPNNVGPLSSSKAFSIELSSCGTCFHHLPDPWPL